MPELYTCPMHPEIIQPTPGRCPKCGMALVKQSEVSKAPKDHSKEHGMEKPNYAPLFTILGLILLVVLVVNVNEFLQTGVFSWETAMMQYMAGFFLVFSGFKFLDIHGFAAGYSTYDLLAQRVFGYGFVYPFIELAFGLAYLTQTGLQYLNPIVVVVMVFSSLGVIQSLRAHRTIQCACLGTVIKLPLGTVTLIEDLGMAAMALMLALA